MKFALNVALSIAVAAGTVFTALGAFAEPKDAKEMGTPSEAVAVLLPTKGNKTRGVILLKQRDGFVHIVGKVRGLSPGKHGFHIHQYGDLRAADGTSAGGHYSPQGHKHGGPDDAEHHAGDLGNIVADGDGIAQVDKMSKDFKLHFVIGRAIVIHAGADDLTSQPSGDAGPRAALGVIGFAQVKDLAPADASRSRTKK